MTKTDLRSTSVGEITALLPSWRLHLQASNLSPRTIRAYTDDGALLAAFLADRGMPTAVRSITREHVEAFIAAEACAHRARVRGNPLPALAAALQLA
jgi:membrane carboxypeptidase/penicillin-binding protein